jgi:hypothetical protein
MIRRSPTSLNILSSRRAGFPLTFKNQIIHKGKDRKHNHQIAIASCPAPFSLRLTLDSSRTQSLVEAIPNVRGLKKESEVM